MRPTSGGEKRLCEHRAACSPRCNHCARKGDASRSVEMDRPVFRLNVDNQTPAALGFTQRLMQQWLDPQAGTSSSPRGVWC